MASPQLSAPVPRWTGFQDSNEDQLCHDDESAAASLLRNTEDGAEVAGDDLQDGAGGCEVDNNPRREAWDNPRINMYRYCAVNLSFFVMGMHDGCIGVCIKTDCTAHSIPS